MRSSSLLGASLCIVLSACGPSREELPQRDARADGVASDARVDAGSGMDSGTACPTGATRCGSDCVNTNTSNMHCGGCGRACAAGQTCQMGMCQGSTMCTGGQVSCGGRCVDTNNDSANCGACGRMCSAGQSCQMGMCRAGGCVAPNMMCGASCVDVSSSNTHCGRCDNACPAGQTCRGGTCQSGGGMCVDPCSTTDQCRGSCAAPAAGFQWACCDSVCIQNMTGTCGGATTDGGTADGGTGDGGADLLCLLGLVRCGDDATCRAQCAGIAERCVGGACE